MILIYSAKDITEAHIVSGMLSSNGIEAHVGGHYLQGGIGELPAINTANIFVAKEDLCEAQKIITEYEYVDKKQKDKETYIAATKTGIGNYRKIMVTIITILIVSGLVIFISQ